MDGIDVALIETDGEDVVERGAFASTPYSDEFRADLRRALVDAKPIFMRGERPGCLAEVERELTAWHGAAVKHFLITNGIDANSIDVIGFHARPAAVLANAAKAFDSSNATMRLAALVGEDKNLGRHNAAKNNASIEAQADTKRSSQTQNASASSTWQKLPKPGPRRPAPAENSQLRLIWIGSAVLVLGAAALLLVL